MSRIQSRITWHTKNQENFSLPRKRPGEGNGTPLQYSCLESPMDRGVWWAAVHGVANSRTRLSDFTFTFHFHALEKEMATHSSVLAWRIPGLGEPGGLPSMGSPRVRHNWSDLAAAGRDHQQIMKIPRCHNCLIKTSNQVLQKITQEEKVNTTEVKGKNTNLDKKIWRYKKELDENIRAERKICKINKSLHVLSSRMDVMGSPGDRAIKIIQHGQKRWKRFKNDRKIQFSSIMKSLHKLGQNLVKDVSETSMAIIMLSGEDWMLCPHIGNKARSSPLLNIILEILAREIRQERDKRHPDCKRRSKTISIHVWQDLIYRKSQESTKTSIRVNGKLSKVVGYAINIQKLVAFLYTSHGQFKKQIPSTASKIIKYLRINLTKLQNSVERH